MLGIIFPSGWRACQQEVCGIGISADYHHDSLWHISLASYGFTHLPFMHPSQAGTPLTGYNYLLDLILYGLTLVGIPAMLGFFQVLPLLFIVLYPYLLLRLARLWRYSYVQTATLLFFCYFGSSLAAFLTWYHTGSFQNSSLWRYPQSLALQSGTMLYNLQFAYSILVIVYLLPRMIKKKWSFADVFALAMGVFLATGFKFYAGLVIVMIFGIAALPNREKIGQIVVLVASFIVSVLVFYNPLQATQSGSIFVLDPLVFSQKMIEDQLLFYHQSLTDARYFLYANGLFSPRLIAIESYSILLFILYNYGVRIFGCMSLRLKRTPIAIAIVASTAFVLLFVQKGDWFNTMQFLFYGVWLANIPAAEYTAGLISSRHTLKILAGSALILVTLISNSDQVQLWNKRKILIPEHEVSALTTLRSYPDGAILLLQPITGNYVTALSGKPLYVGDLQQLVIVGVPFDTRLKQLETITAAQLSSMPIRYIYLNKAIKRDRNIIAALQRSTKFHVIARSGAFYIFEKKGR